MLWYTNTNITTAKVNDGYSNSGSLIVLSIDLRIQNIGSCFLDVCVQTLWDDGSSYRNSSKTAVNNTDFGCIGSIHHIPETSVYRDNGLERSVAVQLHKTTTSLNLSRVGPSLSRSLCAEAHHLVNPDLL